jgi:hypothetical protein
MGKKDVVKPGQFKLRGKVRPGKDTVPELNKESYTEEKKAEELGGVKPVPAGRRRMGNKAA